MSLVLAACGRGDSGNVMAPDVNALSPAQIDAALGPEVVGNAGNAVEAANDATIVESAPPEDTPRPARSESAAPEPESEPADNTTTDDNSAE
jgi:hypothetical protein